MSNTYRVSCNKAQYKRRFETFLLEAGLYTCWIGDITTTGPASESINIDGSPISFNVQKRIWNTLNRLKEGDRLVMAGRTDFYIGTMTGPIDATLVDDNTPLGLSARAAVHNAASKSHKRDMEEVATKARALGVENLVVEIQIPVRWSCLKNPTAAQIEWATGTQGSVTTRALPFPEPAADASLTHVMSTADRDAAAAAVVAAKKARLQELLEAAKRVKEAAKAAAAAAVKERKAKNRVEMKAIIAAYKQAQRTGTEFIPVAAAVTV